MLSVSVSNTMYRCVYFAQPTGERVKRSDRRYLFAFLDKLTKRELATLRFNLEAGVTFSVPCFAMPVPGQG